MLEHISLRNFKGFKDLENLKVRPITILCGTNSCGKSSILQSILLLKQTLESQDPNQILLLNGRFVVTVQGMETRQKIPSYRIKQLNIKIKQLLATLLHF